MADAEEVMAGLPRRDGVSYIGLALNRRGVERALEAGCHEVNFVVVASETFNRRNQGASVEETLATWNEVAALRPQCRNAVRHHHQCRLRLPI